MIIETYQCPKCKQWIYSRARHDYKKCGCGELAVDGGHYDKDLWVAESIIGHINPETKKVTIETTKQKLYKDWNENINQLGELK